MQNVPSNVGRDLMKKLILDNRVVSISAITITDSDGKSILHIAPDAFPATRFIVKRDAGDDRPVEYVQVG